MDCACLEKVVVSAGVFLADIPRATRSTLSLSRVLDILTVALASALDVPSDLGI